MGLVVDKPRPGKKGDGRTLQYSANGDLLQQCDAAGHYLQCTRDSSNSNEQDRHPIQPHMQDPGAPQLTIYFKDIRDAAIKTFHAGEISFLGTTTVWDPNGIIILVRAPAPFY